MKGLNVRVSVTDEGAEVLDQNKGGVEIHHRDTDSQQVIDAIGDALRYGNRKERRRTVSLGGTKDGGAIALSKHERNRRNAQRRVAKRSRKRKGK